MDTNPPDVAKLERLRALLDDQITTLRKSLHNWQTRDSEYEALKSEFSKFKTSPSEAQLVELSQSFQGKRVKQHELSEIAGHTIGLRRLPDQILRVLKTRQDEAIKNGKDVGKQLDAAEKRLASLQEEKEEFENEDGLPIVDIREELDDEGNVISTTLEKPRSAAAQVVEALGKSGVDLDNVTTELPERPKQEPVGGVALSPNTNDLVEDNASATSAEVKATEQKVKPEVLPVPQTDTSVEAKSQPTTAEASMKHQAPEKEATSAVGTNGEADTKPTETSEEVGLTSEQTDTITETKPAQPEPLVQTAAGSVAGWGSFAKNPRKFDAETSARQERAMKARQAAQSHIQPQIEETFKRTVPGTQIGKRSVVATEELVHEQPSNLVIRDAAGTSHGDAGSTLTNSVKDKFPEKTETTSNDEQPTGLGTRVVVEYSHTDAGWTSTDSTKESHPEKTETTSNDEQEFDPSIVPENELFEKARNTVPFAAGTKEEQPAPKPEAPTPKPQRKQPNVNVAKDFYSMSTPGHSRIVELDDEDRPIGSMPINPRVETNTSAIEETEEEAKLRREMLQYSLGEVGAVVAEIDLEEGDDFDDDYDDDEVDDDFDDDFDEEDDLNLVDSDLENEDDMGRSTRSQISDDYRKQMLELEAKLNARMMENVGPQPSAEELTEVEKQAEEVHKQAEMNKLVNSAHRLKIMKDVITQEDVSTQLRSDMEEGSEQPPKKSKGVRFAKELDVSPAPSQGVTPTTKLKTTEQPAVAPLSASIVERSGPAPADTVSGEPQKPKKVSRFKSARKGSAAPADTQPGPAQQASLPPIAPEVPRQRTTPTGPKDAIIANSIIENDSGPAAEPDELDTELLRCQAATMYHEQRNRMIAKQGGFLKHDSDEEEDTLGDLYEKKEDGTFKKVSRFRAARLKAQGY